MTAERWHRIKFVFEQADAAPLQERAPLLDRLCAGDPELRREVEQLLAADNPATFVLGAIGEAAATMAPGAPIEQDRFGNYRIVRRIGQGGMGAVYEAQRTGDFEKRVALKIIRHEFDSEFARTRFQQERQLLATLEHPYIARLLDGGESKSGAPYLVMEFVDGVPLHEFCATLDRTGRLRLFLKVCQAVEYAHRNLVIHRDLKPANILVTAEGEPKLLDFGVAKLLDPGAAQTQTAILTLTPDYASPEQVRGLFISTATDVYALGVILYQLLTDRKPYTLETVTTFEMDRVICELPPTPPGLGDELDHILMMALRKEPERRYSSVQRFADDLENYLTDRPVTAQPDTHFYRLRKSSRRNWVALLAAAITFTAVFAGAGIAVYQARVARQRFQQVRSLSHRFIFDFNDQIRQLPGSTPVREMMVNTALEYLDNLSQSAHGDADLEWELAKAYEKVGDVQGSPVEPSLGHVSAALTSYKKAIGMQETLFGKGLLNSAQRESLAHAYAQLNAVYRVLGRRSEALHASERGVEIARTSSEIAYARSLSHLALGQLSMADPHQALATATAAQTILRREAGAHPTGEPASRLAAIVLIIGVAEARMASFDEAAAHFAEAIALRERRLAEVPLDSVTARELILAYHSLADIFGGGDRFNLGRTDEAEALYRKALALAEKMLASDPRNASARIEVARSAGKLGASIERQRPAEAIALYRHAMQTAEATSAEGADQNGIRASAYRSMAAPLARLGRFSEAEVKLAVPFRMDEQELTKNAQSVSALSDMAEDWFALSQVRRQKDAKREAAGKSLEFADRAAQLAPADFTSAYSQVRAREALIDLTDPFDGAELARQRLQLVDLWAKWKRSQPDSRFIERSWQAARTMALTPGLRRAMRTTH